MNTNLIPDTIITRIASAIERERERSAEEERQKQESLARKHESARVAWDEFEQIVNSSFPVDIMPFVTIERDEIGPGSYEYIHIEVPGLAPIRIRFDRARDESWPMKPEHGAYSVAGVDTDTIYDDGQIDKVGYDWRYADTFADLDDALADAQKSQKYFDEKLAELEAVQQGRVERHRKDEERNQHEAEAEAQAEQEREMEATRQLREEQLLIDALKDDPVAISLLKVFAAVQADRKHWQELVNDVDEVAAWNADRHGESLARAERLAEASSQAAREAEARASSLELDLDDVKRKAHKAGVKV